MFTRWSCIPLVIVAIELFSNDLVAAVITNHDFSDYGPVSSPVSLNTLPVHGWSETGAGGHSLVGESFGAFSSRGNIVLLTLEGEGIRQKIQGFTAGVTYAFLTGYAQAASNLHPTVSIRVFHGDSIDPAHLLSGSDYTLDDHIYGDDALSSAYAVLFTPAGDTVTLLYALKAKDGPNDIGPMIQGTTVEVWSIPEPCSAVLLLGGVVALLALRPRR